MRLNNLRPFLFVLASLFTVVSCKSSPSKEANKTTIDNAATWKTDMHQLSDSLSNLLPLALDPVQFNNPSNQPQIEQEVLRLASFSHAIGQMKNKPASDPSLEFVAKEFNAEMTEAQRQLRLGNRSYARFLIRNATNYCVSCHTQTNRGPQFQLVAGPYFSKMGPLERANYLFAVRSFDEGLKEYTTAMRGPDVALQPFAELESVTLKALAVAVRVKKDPKLADEIVGQILSSKWAPVYLQLSALHWKASLQDWKRHANGKSLAEARTLLSRGWKAQMETPLSRAGIIEFLRASAIMHDLLDQSKPGKLYAETLYSAGLASEALRDLDLYALSGFYYESCIRQAPHTTTSRNCFVRLETVELVNYSAFDSMPIPAHVRQRLEELKSLAQPSGKAWTE